MMTSATAEAWTALERALAGIILLGPCDTSQAQAIGVLASDVPGPVMCMNWLAALYPPPGEEFSLGTVQPDRLAELLLGSHPHPASRPAARDRRPGRGSR